MRVCVCVWQDLDDSWQMNNIYQLPCQPWVNGSCTPAQHVLLNTYRSDMLTALSPLLSSATNGAYLTTCVQHCHQNLPACWSGTLVQGQELQASFLSWYTGANTLQRIVVDGQYGGNPTCYCSPY